MDHSSLARRGATLVLSALLLGPSLAPRVTAAIGESPQEKGAAAKVAKKVDRASKRADHLAKDEREAIAHFQRATKKYADLHDRLLRRLGDQKAVTASALAQAIAADRAKARQGDIFLPEVQALLRRLITEQLTGPDTLAARKAISEGNREPEDGVAPVVVRINAVYTIGAPRSTVPASLLVALPALPASLQYRFVGRDLILVDAVAQVIVDFLPMTAPALPVK